jgi:hypothetical protein
VPAGIKRVCQPGSFIAGLVLALPKAALPFILDYTGCVRTRRERVTIDEAAVDFVFDETQLAGQLIVENPHGHTRPPAGKHPELCHCHRCFANKMGEFIDDLGGRTQAGNWSLFVTQSFRTPSYPWKKGFPRRSEPHPDFVHHFPRHVISQLQVELGCRVEYFYADQFGEIGGRLHQHFGLSSPGLIEMSGELVRLQKSGSTRLPDDLKTFQALLWKRGGFNRILPWTQPASHYIGRYIGRDGFRCHWDWEVGSLGPPLPQSRSPSVGRVVVAQSQQLESAYFRNIKHSWHR